MDSIINHISVRKDVSMIGINETGRWILDNPRIMLPVLALISFFILVFTGSNYYWGDLDHYYVNAGDVLNGLIPYKDIMFEYPPLSLVFMIVPRAISWDLNSFHYICAAMTYVWIALGIYFLYKIADEHIGYRWRVHFLLAVLIVFGTYFVIARNDVYPAVISIIGIWLYLGRRYPLAFVVITVAAMTKLYPAIFLLPMMAPFILRRNWIILGKCIAASAAVILLVELPFLIADPGTAFAYLTYHSDRGIQIESVASGFFMFASLLFPSDIGVVFNYGSDNLTGVGPEALAPFMNAIMAIVLVAFFVIMLSRLSKSETAQGNIIPLVALMSTAMLMLFILFSKVYSAQYFIWIVLALPFTQLACFGKVHRREILAITLVFGIFTMLSYFAYPKYLLVEFNTYPVMMVFMKNILHILLTVEILHLCWYETRTDVNVEEHGLFTPIVNTSTFQKLKEKISWD